MFYCFLAGALLGMTVTLIWCRLRTHGTVVVYFPEDPEEAPYMGFEVNGNTNSIYNRRRVQFDVKVENLNSQK